MKKILKEGKAHKATQKPYQNKPWDVDRKEEFRTKVEDHIKSFDCYVKQIGNDLEIKLGKNHIAQAMFRPDYVGIKKIGDKFVKEFKYTELGNIKKELTRIIKECEKDLKESVNTIKKFSDFINEELSPELTNRAKASSSEKEKTESDPILQNKNCRQGDKFTFYQSPDIKEKLDKLNLRILNLGNKCILKATNDKKGLSALDELNINKTTYYYSPGFLSHFNDSEQMVLLRLIKQIQKGL